VNGERVEYGFPVDADTDPNDVLSDRITFIDEYLAVNGPGDEPWAEPIWTRVVGPWRRLS